jgi:hypothetical protein
MRSMPWWLQQVLGSDTQMPNLQTLAKQLAAVLALGSALVRGMQGDLLSPSAAASPRRSAATPPTPEPQPQQLRPSMPGLQGERAGMHDSGAMSPRLNAPQGR